MEIGMVTPPVGLNLFVTSGITGMSVLEVVRAALPWLGILFVFLIIDHLRADHLDLPAGPALRAVAPGVSRADRRRSRPAPWRLNSAARRAVGRRAGGGVSRGRRGSRR